jgi:hypothetical protein
VSSIGSMKCTNADEVILLLKASDAVMHDLCHAFENCGDAVDASAAPTPALVLKKWYDPQRCGSCESGCWVGDRSRGRFATPADFPLHDSSPYRGLHVRRERLGFLMVQGPYPSPRAKPHSFDSLSIVASLYVECFHLSVAHTPHPPQVRPVAVHRVPLLRAARRVGGRVPARHHAPLRLPARRPRGARRRAAGLFRGARARGLPAG